MGRRRFSHISIFQTFFPDHPPFLSPISRFHFSHISSMMGISASGPPLAFKTLLSHAIFLNRLHTIAQFCQTARHARGFSKTRTWRPQSSGQSSGRFFPLRYNHALPHSINHPSISTSTTAHTHRKTATARRLGRRRQPAAGPAARETVAKKKRQHLTNDQNQLTGKR